MFKVEAVVTASLIRDRADNGKLLFNLILLLPGREVNLRLIATAELFVRSQATRDLCPRF